MSAAPLAGVAAALAVLALWEGLAAVEAVALPRALVRTVARLARVGRDGRPPSAPERRRLALVGAVSLLAAGWLLAGPLAGAVVAAGGPWAARVLLRRRDRRHRAELERAAPAVARAVADALGGGHAISGAVAEAARSVDGAAGAALGAAARELALGEPLDAALAIVCRRARSRSYDVLVAAILLQRDAGGDLAALLRELATAQERSTRLADDARTATAQARFTGVIVAVLPAAAAGIAELASPGALLGVLDRPLTASLAGVALVLQAAGFLAIRRLARVGG